MSLICWGLETGRCTWLVCLKSSLSLCRVQQVQSVWLAPEFALHILNISLKSELLAENTSIWTLNWKVKKSKFCLSRKLPVEAVAHLEKSEGIWDSLNGIVWFLFGCPGWNLIVLHVQTILSFLFSLVCSDVSTLQRSLVRRRQRIKIHSIQKLWFLCHCFTQDVFVWL